MDRWWEQSSIKKAVGRQWHEDEGGLGRGISNRVRTDRTTTTMCAKDGEGNGNNNA